MLHLSVRVPWHDSRWNGTVCRQPARNSFCVCLDRIRAERDEAGESKIAGQKWHSLAPVQLPVCAKESGAFMSPEQWTRLFQHPYQDIPKARATHGHLKPTPVKVPEFATFAVPYSWLLRSGQTRIDESRPDQLPPDEEPPFDSAWVFGRERQVALLNLMFGAIEPGRSLVFFYCKEGQPVRDVLPRMIVGVGQLVSVGPLQFYDVPKNKPTYPLWDRLIRHSVREDGTDGVLLPYHAYLEPTGDPDEDRRRQELVAEIAVVPDMANVLAFSYAAEHVRADSALSVLVRTLEAVRAVGRHGIAPGPWAEREGWLNDRIGQVWTERGAFPGAGPALEALNFRVGTALVLELMATGCVKANDDPWPVLDAMLRGRTAPPQKAYEPHLKDIRQTWVNLAAGRRDLLQLLSRFDLSAGQMRRWFDQNERGKCASAQVTDSAILENPYRIIETDLGGDGERAVSIGVIDRGLLPDSVVAAKHPVPGTAAVGSPADGRRVRAALVSALRAAAADGDALLSETEACERIGHLDLAQPCLVTSDWLDTHTDQLNEVIVRLGVPRADRPAETTATLQLIELNKVERELRKILLARAAKAASQVDADWRKLLKEAIKAGGGTIKAGDPRHKRALEEQAEALRRVTSRRLSVLTGRAGTGKTSVLGALLLAKDVVAGGVLLLAPTGKARVRLGQAANASAMTIAQFLYQNHRYDGERQRPLFVGDKPYADEKTVVIDEASMLTADTLFAIVMALDLSHVDRLLLVGDPNQLPPIGVGRPFADLVGFLDEAGRTSDTKLAAAGGALARLTVEVRTSAREPSTPSDALRLAALYANQTPTVDADRILSEIRARQEFNDLAIRFWKTPEDLHQSLLELFVSELGLKHSSDVAGFNEALGASADGSVSYADPSGGERFQVLSPVRMHPYGVVELNRWIQRRFREKELRDGRQPWGVRLGDDEIVLHDKVIQLRNGMRTAYDWAKAEAAKRGGSDKATSKQYLANGEIGLVAPAFAGALNVSFARRKNLTFAYSKRDFPDGSGPLDLAYALTVHKAQGSEFRTVFVVLPQRCRLLSRELLYTALTRSKDRLVLLVEGDNASFLYDLSRPEASETSRRNTNLFQTVIRQRANEVPFAEHLIHRTDKGHMVRSKSELVIANKLFAMGLGDKYEYERPVEGRVALGLVHPDFSFVDPSGDLIIWEHLGMLSSPEYEKGWRWKRDWYAKNGFALGENLFTTEDDDRGGLDSNALQVVAARIMGLI